MHLSKLPMLILALATLAPVARAQAAPTVTDFKLDNGLEVVVIPDHRAPVVTHMIWYKVGAADETPGKSGLAHFLEHLMFKGTEKNPGDTFSQDVAEIGGQENAFTTSDYTGFVQRVPREHLKEMMALEADRITGLVLTDEVVRPELNVVLEEQNMRVANNPVGRLGEQMDAALYLNHPYGRPAIGWRQEIEKLSRDEALAFYRRFYTPNNAVVIVVGDVSAEQVKADAEATYGKIAPRAENNPRQHPMEPVQEAPRTVTLADSRVEQPSVTRNYLVPSETTAKPGESEALDVLTNVIGSGSDRRLYPTLGVSLSQVEAGIDAVLADVVEHGVTADELDSAKNRLIAEAVYAQDNQATLARWYGAAIACGETVDMVQAWPDHVRAVTPEAVQAVARQWLDRRRSVTGYLVQSLKPQDLKPQDLKPQDLKPQEKHS